MSNLKAVVVVDIPAYVDDISKVELAYGLYYRKRFDGEPIDPTDILEGHEVYPLKLLPERKEDLHYPCNEYVQAVNEGWNACLDKIMEETE